MLWFVSIAFSVHARSKLAIPSIPMELLRPLQSSNTARDRERSAGGESKLLSVFEHRLIPQQSESIFFEKDGNKLKALKNRQHQEASDDNCIFDNCVLGTGDGCPSEQQVCIVQRESGHLRLTPQGIVQQESTTSVSLSFFLIFLLLSCPLVLGRGSVQGYSPRLRMGTVTHISAVESQSCL